MSFINKVKDTLHIERKITFEEYLHGEKKEPFNKTFTAFLSSFVGVIGFGQIAHAQTPSNYEIMLQVYQGAIEAAKVNLQITQQSNVPGSLQLDLAVQQYNQAIMNYQHFIDSQQIIMNNDLILQNQAIMQTPQVPHTLSRGGGLGIGSGNIHDINPIWRNDKPFIDGKAGEIIQKGIDQRVPGKTPGTTGLERDNIIGGSTGDFLDRWYEEHITKQLEVTAVMVRQLFKDIALNIFDLTTMLGVIYLIIGIGFLMFHKHDDPRTDPTFKHMFLATIIIVISLVLYNVLSGWDVGAK